MTRPAADAVSAAGPATPQSVRSLRNLYLFRTGFSAAWVILVLLLASGKTARTVSFLGAVLLVIYPLSDAVASLFDIRSSRVAARWPQLFNLGCGIVAAVAILVAVTSSLAAAIAVFGGWAILTGAVMIFLAARRQRALHGQWLLIISGAGSVFAGIAFVSWTGTAAAGLAALAQYSAGGAVWYLLTALWLTWTTRATERVRHIDGRN
jgi:uncharacterized membrane protein HdeD (DUF308 family)